MFWLKTSAKFCTHHSKEKKCIAFICSKWTDAVLCCENIGKISASIENLKAYKAHMTRMIKVKQFQGKFLSSETNIFLAF